jgi:2OG-Fe(II) oxygenase superfamily
LSLPRTGYNAVLCNLYRDGNGSVELHADNEPEMGPVIGSVSLGAERLFRLKRKDGSVAFSERLPHGSLLIMAGDTQKNFKHEVPKELGVTRPRINLTFRRIEHKWPGWFQARTSAQATTDGKHKGRVVLRNGVIKNEPCPCVGRMQSKNQADLH